MNRPDFQPLIKRLRETHAEIQEMAHGQADAVVDPSTRAAMLLGDAQESLLDRHKRYQSLYEVVACGVVVCTRFGFVEYANSAFCKSLGTTFSELAGRRWPDVVTRVLDLDGKPFQLEQLPDQAVLQSTTSVRNLVVNVELAGGEARWFLAHANRLINPMSGETTGALMSWVDVTDIHMSEQEHIQAAIAEERQRVSRDLHDSLSNRLAAMIWQIEALKNRAGALTSDEIVSNLERLQVQAEDALDDARRAVSNLNMPQREDQSLASALRALLENMVPGPGIRLRFEIEGAPRPVRSQVATACLRVAQEATANAVKHANASEILAIVRFAEGSIAVAVKDNGGGFDPDFVHESTVPSGFGLKNMRRRAEEISGHLTLDSGPTGTTVTLIAQV